MAQAFDFLAARRSQVCVDIIGKDGLFLFRHTRREIDADRPVSGCFAREFDAHMMIARQRHKIGGVTP